MLGAPGSNKGENAMAIADYFQWRYISVADMLVREEAKKSEDGKRIADCFKANKMGNSNL
jgi:adenylate kinase family enzyme